MKHSLYAGAATFALMAGAAHADKVTVFGPWLGPDQENVEKVLDSSARTGCRHGKGGFPNAFG